MMPGAIAGRTASPSAGTSRAINSPCSSRMPRTAHPPWFVKPELHGTRHDLDALQQLKKAVGDHRRCPAKTACRSAAEGRWLHQPGRSAASTPSWNASSGGTARRWYRSVSRGKWTRASVTTRRRVQASFGPAGAFPGHQDVAEPRSRKWKSPPGNYQPRRRRDAKYQRGQYVHRPASSPRHGLARPGLSSSWTLTGRACI